MTVKVITGDCLDVLRGMPAGSVELCVTSPPYDDLRTYGGFTWNFEGVAHQLYRVLVDGGMVCWNVGDQVVGGSETLTSFRQAIFFKDQVGFRVHDTMIWEKVNFANPEKVRYHQLFEYVFILSKGSPRTFNPIKDKPNATAGMVGHFGTNTYTKRDGEKSTRTSYVTQEYGMRGNVWRGLTAGQENMCKGLPHPAMMPRWLANDLILSWSIPGDTVLDPFAGSGTTGLAADRHHRNAILIELNPSYAQMARERITADGPLFAEVTA